MMLEAWIPAGLAALGGIIWTKGLDGRIGIHSAKIDALERNNAEIKATVDKIYTLLLRQHGRHGQS